MSTEPAVARPGTAEGSPQLPASVEIFDTIARNYKSLRKLPPDKKDEVRQRWQEYQSLPPDQKRALQSQARSGPPGGRIPAPPMTPPEGQRSR